MVEESCQWAVVPAKFTERDLSSAKWTSDTEVVLKWLRAHSGPSKVVELPSGSPSPLNILPGGWEPEEWRIAT